MSFSGTGISFLRSLLIPIFYNSTIIISQLGTAAAEKATQNRGAIQIIRTHLYGEKLPCYGRTVKLGGFSPFSATYEVQ